VEEQQAAPDCLAFRCENCGQKVTVAVERRGYVEVCPSCGSYVDVPDGPCPDGPEISAAGQMRGDSAVEIDRPPHAARGTRTTFHLWMEVLAVLCLAYLPVIYSALASRVASPSPASSFVDRELWRIIRALGVSLPLLMIISLSKDPWRMFGIVRPRWIADIAGAFAILIVAGVASRAAMLALPSGLSATSPVVGIPARVLPPGVAPFLLLLLGLAASSLQQELVMRAYLIPRLERLLGSTWLALLISTALFASYHVYQGVPGTISAAAFGLVVGLAFCVSRRLWPICVAHMLHNLLVYLR
jgi:membrane protease YdiL (CAAX protease family)